MSTVTIEAIDLADLDWTPCCEVLHTDMQSHITTQCERPAAFVIAIRHCVPYTLFSCAPCIHRAANWYCRLCDARVSAPVVIGKAS